MIFSASLFITQPKIIAFAQQEFNNAGSTEAVTSTNDAVIKSILVISQVSTLGIIFNHAFFHKISNNKLKNQMYKNENNEYIIYYDNQYLKRFTIIVIFCCISLLSSSACIILLQTYELAQELTLDLSSTFSILLDTSSGHVWIMRSITSSIIIGLVIFYYILEKRRINKKVGNDQMYKNKMNNSNFTTSLFLMVTIIFCSINLFSNSMISHSNALSSFSSLAISIDWIHFIAASIWIGGLFYFSTVLFKSRISHIKGYKYTNTNNKSNIIRSMQNTYYISILLTYFSFIAITSLVVIGITGLYLGLIHLQSINAIYNSTYGNILIIKLCLAFPMILLGRYNQLKMQKHVKLTKNILKNNNNYEFSAFTKQIGKRFVIYKQINRSVKVESILGILVLIAASFLSVTSPPSLETTDQDQNLGNNDKINSSNGTNNIDFSALVIILSIIILISGIVNFRKNQKKIKEIFVAS
jgi:putative copper export protein